MHPTWSTILLRNVVSVINIFINIKIIFIPCFVVWDYNNITTLTQICRNKRLKGALESKYISICCVGIVYMNFITISWFLGGS